MDKFNLEQVGFITHGSEGRHTPWGTLGCLSKGMLETKAL